MAKVVLQSSALKFTLSKEISLCAVVSLKQIFSFMEDKVERNLNRLWRQMGANMNRRMAFIFPGQGAQYASMGKDFYEKFGESKKVFDKASDLLSMDMAQLCFEENERLSITEYTQAAMLTTMAAMLAHIKTLGIVPSVCAGLSLGEYAALLAADVVSFEDAILLVRKRGIFMQEAVPAGGAMSAVLGLSEEMTEKICADTEGIVEVANYNCPGQQVISGECAAVAAAGEKLMASGAKKVVPLKVSGPFHSSMLAGAGEKLAAELLDVSFKDPVIPYVSNVTAKFVTSKEAIQELLVKQIASAVKWQQSIELMIQSGVATFVEIGPGKTLSSFVKKINREMKVISIDKVSDLEKFV